MATKFHHNTNKRNNNNSKDDIVRGLNELFGNVLHVDIIKSVASTYNYDVNKSSDVLLELSSSVKGGPTTPKQRKPSKPPKKPESTNPKSKRELEAKRVKNVVSKGYKVLILLRGVPGSGKTYLARQLLENVIEPANFPLHILSTDDFFHNKINNKYEFDGNKIQEAHGWNHSRAFQAMSRGVSPVIIDNTNTQMWEMKPYAMMATDYGYYIEILEPTTWWCTNDKELTKRCIHNVSKTKIKDMLDRYEKNVTTHKLLMAYSLTYKFQKPPQMRLMPPINQDLNELVGGATTNSFEDLISFESLKPEKPKQKMDKLLDTVEVAWGIDEKALQSWDIVEPIQSEAPLDFQLIPETDILPVFKDSETNTDSLDFDMLNIDNFNLTGSKTILAKSRDINFGLLPKCEKIPKKLKLDKSCLTDDDILENSNADCIDILLNMFPKIPKSHLTDIYEKCERKFNWTVDVLLSDNNCCIEYTEKPEPEFVPEPVLEFIVPEPELLIKNFRRKLVSDESKELKKCLESKIDINKEHYSDHVFKVKQYKFGEPSTSQINCDSDSDLDAESGGENLMELNLGNKFVQQLEVKFGDSSMVYPKGFQPVIQIPTDLARQLYTFYLESVYQQMEAQNEILNDLVKEDEEFARKLQEQENYSSTEPAVGQWQSMNAETLADKLTKSKLFNLFPDIDHNCIMEIYKAYKYDFKETVRVLMGSCPELIVNSQEVPLTEKTVKEIKEAEKDDYFDEAEEELTGLQYRAEANKYLEKREELYQKAQTYFQKGMREVAQFYSELAKKQTNYYDRANNLAATKFLDENSQRLQKFDTIDLHFLHVKEALSALDMFIDRNINLMKGNSGKMSQLLFVITGRGKNSEGGVSKIKPAVITRLKKRNISFGQLNPGLLQIKIRSSSPMTVDLS